MDGVPFGRVMHLRTAQPWTLLLVDAHPFTRQCMADLLGDGDLELSVRTAAAVDMLGPEHCAACSMVLLRLDWTGEADAALAQALERLGQLLPGVPTVVLSGHCDMDTALAAIRLGVRGYLSPALGIEQILAALRLLRGGGMYIAPDTAAAPVDRPREPSLTPREAEVLAHLRQGKPNKLIAYDLGLAENTVKAHVAHILKKLGAANRTAIASGPVDEE